MNDKKMINYKPFFFDIKEMHSSAIEQSSNQPLLSNNNLNNKESIYQKKCSKSSMEDKDEMLYRNMTNYVESSSIPRWMRRFFK